MWIISLLVQQGTIGIARSACRYYKASMVDTFLYFGFGSNLLTERIHINNPTAQFYSIGKLQNYKLDFDFKSSNWKGAVATITECPGDHLWGVIWEINKENLESLDRQEGVEQGIYRPLEVEVSTPKGSTLKCRTYQLLIRDQDSDHRPSPQYLEVILKGAEENRLPVEYQQRLRKIEHNGYQGSVHVYDSLKSLSKS